MNKNFRTNIVYVFWMKVDGLLRIDIEKIQNIARKLLGRSQIVRAEASSIKSVGETRRTRDSYHGHMTYGTRNTIRNR
jgi:hypothetical protein